MLSKSASSIDDWFKLFPLQKTAFSVAIATECAENMDELRLSVNTVRRISTTVCKEKLSSLYCFIDWNKKLVSNISKKKTVSSYII